MSNVVRTRGDDIMNSGISQRKMAYLNWEINSIQRFLNDFEPARNGLGREAILGHTGEFVIVKNYPLPDRYRPDYVDLLLIVDNYPNNAPVGIYLMHKNNAATIRQISDKFNTFQNNAYHGAQAIQGYTWICWHYGSGCNWKFRADAPQHGDNLRKFLATFYAELL
jgi:hypothetical protein